MPRKCYVNSCQHAENSKFAFWSFLEKFFSPNISHLQFAESRDVKPIDTEVSTVVDSGKPLPSSHTDRRDSGRAFFLQSGNHILVAEGTQPRIKHARCRHCSSVLFSQCILGPACLSPGHVLCSPISPLIPCFAFDVESKVSLYLKRPYNPISPINLVLSLCNFA